MAKSNGSGVSIVLHFHLESLGYIHREQSVNEKRGAGWKCRNPAWRAVHAAARDRQGPAASAST
ncbi:protein of unknown function [Burkholderia multivorans]